MNGVEGGDIPLISENLRPVSEAGAATDISKTNDKTDKDE